jgi:hypothetical protein
MNYSDGSIFRVGSILLVVMMSLQAISQQTVAIKVAPAKATVYVGETQNFTAVLYGVKSSELNWSIREPHGGKITEKGAYTAPREIGIYHIVASSKTDSRTEGVATVTVVQQSDPPTDFK